MSTGRAAASPKRGQPAQVCVFDSILIAVSGLQFHRVRGSLYACAGGGGRVMGFEESFKIPGIVRNFPETAKEPQCRTRVHASACTGMFCWLRLHCHQSAASGTAKSCT